jgi:hypothetical protein
MPGKSRSNELVGRSGKQQQEKKKMSAKANLIR